MTSGPLNLIYKLIHHKTLALACPAAEEFSNPCYILQTSLSVCNIQVIIWPRCASRSYWHWDSHFGPMALARGPIWLSRRCFSGSYWHWGSHFDG